jgi:inositol transport system ATP-binding protein
MASEQDNYVLEMRDVTKAFPGVLALDKVSLKVRAGTTHVLVGENGAGKSTLMKILSGEHQVDSGEIRFRGAPFSPRGPKVALEMGVSMIHQELSPVLGMTIAENIFLGREPAVRGAGVLSRPFVDFGRMERDTRALLDRLGLKYAPQQKMRELSVAGMQLIEISKAISRGAQLIIMDEPTSAISDAEVEMLFAQIRDLKANGVAIIYISHKMDEIFKIADDITIIRDGRYVDSGPASAYDESRLISLMVGRTISSIFPKAEAQIGDTVLEVRNATRHGAFRDVSFEVRRGEIVGLAGLIGAGRTEVARAIFGLDALDAGRIMLKGQPLKLKGSASAIKHGIAMVSEDRKEEGLVLCRSVQENIALANLDKFVRRGLIDARRERTAALKMKEMLKIKAAHLQTVTGTLSGGNQQKIVIAKWLLGELSVLILDEPTRGIDVGSKSEIHRLMSQFAQQGLAIIMISSELPEILGMSDRVIVMHEGEVTGQLNRSEASQERIMKLATGGRSC